MLIPERIKDAAKHFKATHMRDLFEQNPHRFAEYSIETPALLLDFSKNLIDKATLSELATWLENQGFSKQRAHLFCGNKVNFTEQRAALHTALRHPHLASLLVDGQDVMVKIKTTLHKMFALTESLHTQQWRGFSGKPITDIVNIGIGGSDLGPRMVTQALAPYHNESLKFHFVSNVDGHELLNTLRHLSQETTLFIVSSKTFTTIETLTNAETAKAWLLRNVSSDALHQHFLAVTMNIEKAQSFGIPRDNIFPIWDWVGGRFSLWSATGLPILMSVGKSHFMSLLNGAYAMDQHFLTADLTQNMPVILALLSFWYGYFFDARSQAIIPYDYHLQKFPSFLQQLEMESCGKQVNRAGNRVNYSTGPVLWGDVGTNGQHAFFQLLHQGTHFIPIDFIAAINPHHKEHHHHELLLANCLGQSKSLLFGKDTEALMTKLQSTELSQDEIIQLVRHKTIPGNKPNNVILMPKLSPETLGALIALYEHKIFTQSVLWDINPFDQWGVELGKQNAQNLYSTLSKNMPFDQEDSSTHGLLDYYFKHKNHSREG